MKPEPHLSKTINGHRMNIVMDEQTYLIEAWCYTCHQTHENALYSVLSDCRLDYYTALREAVRIGVGHAYSNPLN